MKSPELHQTARIRPRTPLAILLAGVLLAQACSKEGSGADPAPTPAPPPAGAFIPEDVTRGKPGGSLTIGITGEPVTLNPVFVADNASARIADLLFDRLIDFDHARQKITQGLAESWNYEPETRRWVFNLRPNLKWSDGHPITSDDLMFFTEVVMDPRHPSVAKEAFVIGGEPVAFSAPDPFTFAARLPSPDSFSLISLGMIQPMPRHVYGEAYRRGDRDRFLSVGSAPREIVNSGPFRVREIIPGAWIVFEPNPHYYRFDSAGTRLPYLKSLTVMYFSDEAALANAYAVERVNLLDSIPPEELGALVASSESGGYTVHNPGLELSGVHFWFNTKPGGRYLDHKQRWAKWETENPDAAPPPAIAGSSFQFYVDRVRRKWFEDVRFRKACSFACDRERMVAEAFGGHGAAVHGFVSPSNRRWHNDGIGSVAHDPGRAAELLAELGMMDRDGDGVREDREGNRVEFTLMTNQDNPERVTIARLLSEDLALVGIRVTVRLTEFSDLMHRIGKSHDYDAILLGTGSGHPPHPAMMRDFLLSSSPYHYWNPNQTAPATAWEGTMDGLFQELRSTFDAGRQKNIFDGIQFLYAEQQPMIHLVARQAFMAGGNRIGNLKPSVVEPGLTHNLEELFYN